MRSFTAYLKNEEGVLMIPMLIEEAIKIKLKSDMHPAIISDYELAYALGYACKKLNIKTYSDLKKMRENVIEAFKSFNKKGLEDENLISMITVYEVSNNAPENDKVQELINMGYSS